MVDKHPWQKDVNFFLQVSMAPDTPGLLVHWLLLTSFLFIFCLSPAWFLEKKLMEREKNPELPGLKELALGFCLAFHICLLFGN